MRLMTAMVALAAISGCTPSTSEGTQLHAETTTSLVATTPDVDPMEETTTTSFIPTGPSQSAEDALRDGVVAELAALPFDDRVHQYPEHFGPTQIETSEGVWIISVPYAVEDVYRCELGDTAGVYGLDWICPSEYGEILLLDSATGEIQKAYPFSALEPRALAITEDAIYCIRQGDGAAPDSMLCRIDRTTRDITVRVFPWAVDSMFDPSSGNGVYIPDTWTFEEPAELVLFEEIEVRDDIVFITGHSGSAEVDPLTLELTLEG